MGRWISLAYFLTFFALQIFCIASAIEIAFTTGNQRMITYTYIQPPGQPRNDGILHTIYGGVSSGTSTKICKLSAIWALARIDHPGSLALL